MTIIKEGSVSTDLNVFAGKYADEREVLRALREAVIAETDATNMYEKLSDTLKQSPIKNPNVKRATEVLQDIANEEKVHIGELHKLISMLDSKEVDSYKKGAEEVGN